jgi:galactose-1-phosphate uridylyltransferase
MFANPLPLTDDTPATVNFTVMKITDDGSQRVNLAASDSSYEYLLFRHQLNENKPKQHNRHNAHLQFTEYDATTGEPYKTNVDFTISRNKKASEDTADKLVAEMASLLVTSGFVASMIRGGN